MRSATGPAALNGALRLTFDEDLDPLSVTRSSVRVADAAGRPLESRLEVDGPVLSVLLVVGPELLASPPQRAQVRLAGLPSVHALSTRSGRRLRATVQAGFELRPGLEGRSGGGSELVAINGRPVSAGVPVTPNGPLVLGFDGVIDPDTVTAAGCPLFPTDGTLQLEPVVPRVAWQVVGQRFEVRLQLDGNEQSLEFHTRRSGLRALDGSRVEPLVVVDVLNP